MSLNSNATLSGATPRLMTEVARGPQLVCEFLLATSWSQAPFQGCSPARTFSRIRVKSSSVWSRPGWLTAACAIGAPATKPVGRAVAPAATQKSP